jgi:hypothetical protein
LYGLVPGEKRRNGVFVRGAGLVYLCASGEANWHQIASAIVDGLKTSWLALQLRRAI